MGASNDERGLNNLAYFRGKHINIGDLNNSDKVPFHVNWSERNKNPDDLQAQIIKTLVPEWEKKTDDDDNNYC